VRRSLRLNKETLTELTTAELDGIAGATGTVCAHTSLAVCLSMAGGYSCSECYITRDELTLLNCGH
jgi:hypothetical protein